MLSAADILLIKEYTTYVLQGAWSDDRTCAEALDTLPAVMVMLGRGDRTAFSVMEDRLETYKADPDRFRPDNSPDAPKAF